MRRTRDMSIAVSVVLLAALACAGGASAAMKSLTLETAAGPLAAGAPIVLSSSEMRYTTEAGNDECTENVLTGTVSTNVAKKVAISVEAASFTGKGFGETTECFDTEPAGPSTWTTEGFPWPLTLSTKGVGKLAGSPKITMIEEKPAEGKPVPRCTWQASKLASSFAQVGTTPEPLELNVDEQPMKRDPKASNPVCPRTGKLNLHFTATSGSETVLAHT